MESFPSTETTFLLPGIVGNIEVLASPLISAPRRPATAIICHPHPLYGGTMHHKVVSVLARTCHELGVRTVRFNFRGVGQSAGTFSDGIGESEDLLKVVDWVKSVNPGDAIWLAGFSFGAYVSARVATRIPVAQLMSIAPQVSRFIDAQLPEITCPWLLAQGESDEVVSPEAVFKWIEDLKHKPLLIRMEGAGHFFHGRLLELRQRLVQGLTELLNCH